MFLPTLIAVPDLASAFQLEASPGLCALACLGLCLAHFGTLAAASLLCFSPAKIQMRAKDAEGQAVVDELARHEQGYQVVARFFALGGLVSAFLALKAGTTGEAQDWVLVLTGAVALFLCAVLPAAVAQARAESILLRILPVLRWSHVVLRFPIVTPVLAMTHGTLHVLGLAGGPKAPPEAIAEEVMAAVSDSVTATDLQAEERQWIGNIVTLKEQQVAAIMTPRTDVVAIAADTPLDRAVAWALEHGFSRYPVYGSGVDDVVGMFYVKDALALAVTPAGGRPSLTATAPVRTLMREPFLVPETMGVAQLLHQFKQKRQQMAVVLDEYGGTAGVVSVEDVLEEIVGDIADEYDAQEEKSAPDEARVRVIEQGRIVEVPGRLPVAELNRILAIQLPERPDYDTVAGFVTSHLSRIPAIGETFQADGVEFRILQADDRRLARLRVTALQPQAAEQDG